MIKEGCVYDKWEDEKFIRDGKGGVNGGGGVWCRVKGKRVEGRECVIE